MTTLAVPRPVRMLAIAFTVAGEPIPQGSHKAFVVGKRAIVTDDNPRLKAWRRHVSTVAKTAAGPGWVPLDCPLAIRLDFTMPKPASYPKRRRTWPSASADLDKATRSIFDSLTTAGVITNDARFVELRAAKHFPGEDPDALPVPGVRIAVWSISEAAQPTLDGDAL